MKIKENMKWLLPILVVLLVISVWGVSGYLLFKMEDRGSFGDMFGAVNALFSGLAFAGVIFAILLQRLELSLQRKELELTRSELAGQKNEMQLQNKTLHKQKFENTFFSLLEQHNLALEKITKTTFRTLEGGSTQQQDSLSVTLKIRLIGGGMLARTFQKFQDLESSKAQLLKYNNSINQYFRVLYQLLKFVANNCPDSTIFNVFSVEKLIVTKCSSQEKMYSNIVRSFLPEEIYCLLAINCSCTDKDDHFYKYKLLLERYSLLEHMLLKKESNVNNNLTNEIMCHYQPIAFGDNADYLKKRGDTCSA